MRVAEGAAVLARLSFDQNKKFRTIVFFVYTLYWVSTTCTITMDWYFKTLTQFRMILNGITFFMHHQQKRCLTILIDSYHKGTIR